VTFCLLMALRFAALPDSVSVRRAFTLAHVVQCDAVALAVIWRESRGDALATSRVVAGVRYRDSWRGDQPPTGLQLTKGLYCGILQTQAWSWADCLAQRDDALAAVFWRHERDYWLVRCGGDLTCALGGLAAGNAGAVRGSKHGTQIRFLAARLEKGSK
jgi:hypothetical protein